MGPKNSHSTQGSIGSDDRSIASASTGALEASLAHERAIVTDRSGRVLAATAAFHRLVGRRAVVGSTPPFPWWPPEDREFLGALFDRVVLGSADDLERQPFRLRVLHASGRRIAVDVTFQRTRGDHVCFLHDPALAETPVRMEKERVSTALSFLTSALEDLGVRAPPMERTGWRRLARQASLTERESEILALLLIGRRSDQIADLFALSPHTVKHHIQSIFRKVGVRSHVELLANALIDRTTAMPPPTESRPRATRRPPARAGDGDDPAGAG